MESNNTNVSGMLERWVHMMLSAVTGRSLIMLSCVLAWLHTQPRFAQQEKFSPTLALLWTRVETRMVIWYVFGNGKHQIPRSHTLKQGDALHILSPAPEEDICRKVNLTLSHVLLFVGSSPGCCLCTVQTQTDCFSCQTVLLKTSHLPLLPSIKHTISLFFPVLLKF